MGLCRYDGFQFVSPSEEIPSGNISASFSDREGNLWFGYNDGMIVRYDGKHFTVADSAHNNTSVNQIAQTPDGSILAVTQNEGVGCISEGKTVYFSEGLEDKLLYSVCCIDGTRLLLGCGDGLYVCRYAADPFSLQIISRIEATGDESIPSIIRETDGDNFRIATGNGGLFYLNVSGNGFSARRIDVPELEDVQLQSIYEDRQGNLWVSTFGKGLFRLRLSRDEQVEKTDNYNSSNGLGSDYIKQVFFDNRQNLWVGTYEYGVACLTDQAISFRNHVGLADNNAVSVFSADASEYWVGGDGAIARIVQGADPQIFNRQNGVPNDKITALHIDSAGTLWAGTEQSGLYRLGKNGRYFTPYYSSANSLSNAIQAVVSQDHLILYASRNGVVILDTRDHSSKIINTYNGLPHNNIRDIYRDSQGMIWIAANSNSILSINHWIDPEKEEKRLQTGLMSETEFSCLSEDADGNIWAGTHGAGVFLFDRKNDSVYRITSQNGLKSDFCYAMESDRSGHVWVGHRLGLSMVDVRQRSVVTFGTEYGITGDVNPNAMRINSDNELIAGFTDGVLLYNTAEDCRQEWEPILNLTGVTIGDKSYNPGEPLSLPFNRYRVQFDYIGLQYRQPEAVIYQYMLQGYDVEWSEPSNGRSVLYPRLENGNYRFLVRACNSNYCTADTLLYEFKIRRPFWKTYWFMALMLGTVTGAVYAFIIMRERAHRHQQEYLERELAARTREVLDQKEEIEAKNRDITDSINYAQRIQFSVLPTTKTLLDNCSDAFIFYRPRDIVSGDFYWFNYFPDRDAILIVCADSTGHGVPGAFMSLIGTTLIKDIVMRPEIKTPVDILQRLDENIQSTLNQNQESEQANDGMDVIVCEINTKTCHVRVSSAMRPFVVYHNGEQKVYKGSHVAIGGQHMNNKRFELIELQLAPGDLIYMFTDGYPDQFGGPAGKKFKMNRLQSVLNDIHNRDMDEQHRVLKEHFELWKGNVEQIDDVLMIGVRL
jgi:ligand-binding sensor domain-containing protein/serine phosphatase RsbU (regulator of sigma subunit)